MSVVFPHAATSETFTMTAGGAQAVTINNMRHRKTKKNNIK